MAAMPRSAAMFLDAKAAAGDEYVDVPGADVAARRPDTGLPGEILARAAPVMPGDGVRLLSRPGGAAYGWSGPASRTCRTRRTSGRG
ncbi:hypothetical protein GCM10010116_05970 [Microbispora rosea subsp. aerata]|nr:hypothetical protein [Microbispora rosea]GGO03017.1 hypothetical protein GCM10010116_05970 [Microbispora rosea subsp. aerata]GIH54502.1 hypothetical protein Mro02_14160 [Microbispora rosea subsp. aerata]GLJ82768.1 hypothetical protein GCM10017588_14940 [Microbispora rosea subsp. aerata]